MTLNDLKTGMIVTWRNGHEHVVIRNAATRCCDTRDCMVSYEHLSWNPLSCYNDNFKNKNGYCDFDIVKIEEVEHPYSILDLEYDRKNRKVLWEECRKLTVSEIENLLGYKVEIVSEEE